MSIKVMEGIMVMEEMEEMKKRIKGIENEEEKMRR